MVRLIDSILADAIHVNASDLHFEPEESFLRLRYRIDGKMVQIRSLHRGYWPSMVVRLKIMSGMNIAETRKPQDGRINFIKTKYNSEKLNLETALGNNEAGKPMKIDKYNENSISYILSSYYTIGILSISYFIYKQLKQ